MDTNNIRKTAINDDFWRISLGLSIHLEKMLKYDVSNNVIVKFIQNPDVYKAFT